ncbi:MAG: GNAT family N-acetyltransferase [Desulfobacula sp.]|jgi:ribosomal protein S18 acetylase RimI-like enzyme
MDISIIQAEAEDAAEILALQKVAYQTEAKLNDDWTIPPLTQTLPEIEAEFENKTFLKAMDKDKIIGSVRAVIDSGTCHIGRLMVFPEYQGKKIGTRMMEKIEAAFPNAERFELFTGTRSAHNIRLYKRLGYRECREMDISPKVRLVFMEKMQ